MEEIIKIKNLSKSFGDLKAVDDISFNVKEGELFAFLGVNGAGKSTTINILCSISKRDSGEIFIDGLPLDSSKNIIKSKIGIVFQTSVLDESLSVYDNLKVRASYYGIRGKNWKTRLLELSKTLQIEDLLKKQYKTLSGGQKRRIDIARGLINKPKLLFLDEPTTGLDPKSRSIVWKILEDLQKKEHMTIFLTTHYMEEASRADNVVIMEKGKIVCSGSPIDLKNRYSGDFIKIYQKETEEIDKLLESQGYSYQYLNDRYYIKVSKSSEATDFILKNSEILTDYEVVKGDMDDVFLRVTGKKLEVDAK